MQLNLNMQNYSDLRITSTCYTQTSFGRDITNTHQAVRKGRRRQRTKAVEKVGCDDWIKKLPEMYPIREDLRECARRKGQDSFIKEDFMARSMELECGMREELVGWMMGVASGVSIRDQTLFLAVWILDKFCEKWNISKERYQLLGLSSLFVAAKYEEIKTPKLKEYGAHVRGVYWNHQILDMESEIILMLSFDLRVMTRVDYLKEFLHRMQANQKECLVCSYILELTLVEYPLCLVNPAMVSWAAVVVGGCKMGKNFPQLNVVEQYSLCSYEMSNTVRKVEWMYSTRFSDKFKVVNQKYAKIEGVI